MRVTISDGLFEYRIDFFNVFGHIDGDCIFDSAVGGAEFGIECDLDGGWDTLPEM